MSKSCSRPGCSFHGVALLRYAYSLSQVEVLPIDGSTHTGDYVLCQTHLDRLRLPKGWNLVVHRGVAAWKPSDLEELAYKIRQVGGLGAPRSEYDGTEHSLSSRTNLVTLTSRAHLRVVADVSRYRSRQAS